MILMLFHRRGARLRAAVVATLLLLAAFGAGEAGAGTGSKLRVEAAFYPLQWMAQGVGGKFVEVESLTAPGAEPHDLELTPRDVGRISDADAVVYLHGFQPAVDDAVDHVADRHAFDAATATKLDLTFTPIEEGKAHAEEAGTVDRHFWLDPTKLAEVADDFAVLLGKLD